MKLYNKLVTLAKDATCIFILMVAIFIVGLCAGNNYALAMKTCAVFGMLLAVIYGLVQIAGE